MESILDSTKKVLGIDPSYTAFDVDIIMHINSTFGKLHQLGIGPVQGFMIMDKTPVWEDFLGADSVTLNGVKSFVYLSVRLLFDPPPTSFGIAAFERQIDELAWRLNARREEIVHPYPEIEAAGATIWTLQEGEAFPSDAVPGDIGMDPITGTVWRYV